MAVPNIFTFDAPVYTRLNTGLVTTYASAVWAQHGPEGTLPSQSAKPVVVYQTELQDESTDDGDHGRLLLDVYMVMHRDGSWADLATLVGQVDALLHRWVPSVTGIGTSAIARLGQVAGEWDEQHFAVVNQYEAIIGEG